MCFILRETRTRVSFFNMTYIEADLTCGEPPDVKFATVTNVTDEDYVLGTIVTYSCHHGYSFSGESRIIFCDELEDGDGIKWSEPNFFCSPRSCGDPGYVNNARRLGSRFTFPNFVKFECDEGYKIKGVPTRYCQTSGSWSGRLPSCEAIACNAPEDIDNGHVTYSSLGYSSELRYTCNSGFKLNTDEIVLCEADGQWSKTDVQCIESSCDAPVVPEHGSVRFSDAGNVPRSGTIAIYACEGDRILLGSATSKCLDNGKWLFPAPECLSPCSVPNISNGSIGRSSFGDFYKIPAGRRVEDDVELVISCFHGYEAGDSQNRESKISCSRGIWSLEPQCKPASCFSNPPDLDNAEIINVNHQHGGKVTYSCLPNFKKTLEERVVCDFGQWKGMSKICESTRCFADKLNFLGLRKGYQVSYNDGDIFKIQCEAGYQMSIDGELKCVEGEWLANTPPCRPADCPEPPFIPNTKVYKASTLHGSYATYVCEDPYKLIGYSRVECSFGKWGNLPRCDDGRCETKDLRYSYYISLKETPRYVDSGQELHVTCKAGYSPMLVKPYCLDGKWERNSRSPCREDDCLVPKLDHGDIIEKVLGDPYWSIWQFRYVRDIEEISVPIGLLVSPGTQYHLHCYSGYSFQGSSDEKRRITCTRGKWLPCPDCIPRGEDYGIWTSMKKGISSIFRKKTTNVLPETTPIASTTTSQTPEDSKARQPEIVTTEIPTTAKPVDCSCQYPLNDEQLVATVDGKQMHYLQKVNDGAEVVFRCQYVGYHRFRGPRKIKCGNCKPWHSSEFPTCSKPSRSDAIIVFERSRNISVEGDLEVRKGQNLTLTCIAYEGGSFPTWAVPSSTRATYSEETKVREDMQVTLYMSHLKIENADLENEGVCSCTIKRYAATWTSVNVIVIDPNVQCPEFQANEEIDIIYDNERRVESKATVSCKQHGQELEGKNILKCLRHGNWSDPLPQCHDRKCQILKETELLTIDYPGDREIGSLASFRCSNGTERTGADSAECLENGSWSHPTPTCDYHPCALDDLLSSKPQNVVPDIRNTRNRTWPYNSEVTLVCDNDLNDIGEPIAKCGKNRTWQIKFQCLKRPGCLPIERNLGSRLIVTPEEKFYNFADTVEFSCPGEMELTTDLQQVMCMINNRWSETTVPDCKENNKSPKRK